MRCLSHRIISQCRSHCSSGCGAETHTQAHSRTPWLQIKTDVICTVRSDSRVSVSRPYQYHYAVILRLPSALPRYYSPPEQPTRATANSAQSTSVCERRGTNGIAVISWTCHATFCSGMPGFGCFWPYISSRASRLPVSYTHLTLPTKRIV